MKTIVPIGENLWFAAIGCELDEDTYLIRDDLADCRRLLHICERFLQDHPPGELYNTGLVDFDVLRGVYYCCECSDELDMEGVLSDGLGTGAEYNA